jgi:hypothetical protein
LNEGLITGPQFGERSVSRIVHQDAMWNCALQFSCQDLAAKEGGRATAKPTQARRCGGNQMKTLLTVLLASALFACSSNSGNNQQSASAPSPTQEQPAPAVTVPAGASTNTLHDSTVTFKAAQAACTGALGTVTFSLGHARAHGPSGVDVNVSSTETTGVNMIVFTDEASGKTATIEANGHRRSVTGKNVTVKMRGSVACVAAD